MLIPRNFSVRTDDRLTIDERATNPTNIINMINVLTYSAYSDFAVGNPGLPQAAAGGLESSLTIVCNSLDCGRFIAFSW